MIRVALIGHGYWGVHLARNIQAAADCRLVAIADQSEARCALAAVQYPNAAIYRSGAELLAGDCCDAVVVATPLSQHFSLCAAAIDSAKHVLVEKPLAISVSEATVLVERAYRRGVTLAVDHTFLHSGAIQTIRSLIASDEMGQVISLNSVRVNFGLFRADTNVIWDLAVHDFAIMGYLLPSRPATISAMAGSLPHYPLECVAHISVKCEDGCLASFHVSWLAPEKIRRIEVSGTRKMLVYDDLNPERKITVYDKQVRAYADHRGGVRQEVAYEAGETYLPVHDVTEPLASLISDFIAAINEQRNISCDGMSGLRVVEMLEAAERSLKSGGSVVHI